ncbi:BTB domain-containing protein, partial [Haematococcus lacustris]
MVLGTKAIEVKRCVVQIVEAHPSVVKRGGVTLECDDGELPVLRDVFAVSSPWMADVLVKGCTTVEVSGSTKEEWLLVISQLYPIVPRPELSLHQLQQVLPVVHKYNFPELFQFVSSRLATELPQNWSLDPAAPGYIFEWLVMAEQLQLDALKQAALEGLKRQPGQQIKTQMADNVLDTDLLLLSPELMLETMKVMVEKKGIVRCE